MADQRKRSRGRSAVVNGPLPSKAKELLPQVQCGPLLNAWSQSGKDFTSIYRALKDISRLQVLFAKETSDILKRDEILNLGRRTGVLVDSWKTIFQLIQNSVEEQTSLGLYIQDDLLPSMDTIMKEDLKLHKETQTNYRMSANKVNEAAKNVRKTKKACEKYDDRAKNYSMDPDAEKKKKPKDWKGWVKKGIRDLKHKNDTPEEMAKKAYERSKKAEEDYKEAVIHANDAQRGFLKRTDELKMVVHTHLMRRAQSEITFMRGVADCYLRHIESRKVKHALDHFEENARNLRSGDIVEEQYYKILENHGEDQEAHTEFRVEHNRWRNAFHSLEDAYDAHDTKEHYPKMMEVLCQKIKETGGLKTKGIFRLSASKADIDALKKQITASKTISTGQLPCRDPNIPACLLKEWLRNMSEPLIPSSHYGWCIDTAKQNKLTRETVAIFLKSQLGVLQRESIYYLCNFLCEFIEPEVVKVTSMSISNIAIVFGPTLLRCPTDDPETLLQNTPHEKKFVEFLIAESAQIQAQQSK